MSTVRGEEWHIEKKIPLALIIAVLTQTFGIAWWGSAMSTRVEQLERRAESTASQSERIVRLEEKVGGIQQGIAEIKAILQSRPAPTTPPPRTSDPG